MKFGRIIAAYHQFQDTAGRNASGGKLFVFDEPSQTVVPSVLYRESTHEILQNPLSIDDKGQVTDFVVDADKMYYVLVKDINGDEIYSRHNLTCLEGEGAEGRDYFPGDYISIHEDRTINVDPVRQLLVEAPLTLEEAEDSLTIGIDESQFADKTVVTGSDGITVTSTGNTYNASGRELENKITIVDNKIEGFRDLVQAEQDRAESAEGALENWQAAHGKKLTITDGTNVTEFDGTEDKTVDISVAATKWEDTENGIKPKDDKNVEVTNLNASGSLTVNGVNVLNTSSSIETGRQYAITAGDGDGNVTLTEVQSGGSGLPPYSIDNIGQILKVTNDPTAEEPISARWVDLGEQDSSKWTADDFYSYLTPKSDWSTYSIKGKDFKTRDNYLTIDSDAITFTKPSKITNSYNGGSTVAFIANSPAATSGKQYGLAYDGAEGQYKLSEVVAPDLSEYAKKTDIPPSINAYSKDEADAKFQLIGDYLTKSEATTIYQPKGNYQPAGDYALKSELPDLTPYITSAAADNKYQPKGNYQPAGDYALKTEIPDVSGKQDKLTAGDNITITEDNVISATMELPNTIHMVAGTGIALTKEEGNVVVSNTQIGIPSITDADYGEVLTVKIGGGHGTKYVTWSKPQKIVTASFNTGDGLTVPAGKKWTGTLGVTITPIAEHAAGCSCGPRDPITNIITRIVWPAMSVDSHVVYSQSIPFTYDNTASTTDTIVYFSRLGIDTNEVSTSFFGVEE